MSRKNYVIAQRGAGKSWFLLREANRSVVYSSVDPQEFINFLYENGISIPRDCLMEVR